MLNYSKKTIIFLLAVFILTAIFFSGILDKRENYWAEASLWDIVRAWITINPLFVNVSAPSEIEIDKVFQVKAKVKNKGGEKIEEMKGEIFLPEEIELVKKDEEQEIGTLPSYKEKTISWPVKGKKVGNYVILVKVSGELKEHIVSAEDSTIVEVKEKSTPGQKYRSNLFQRFFDFFQNWFSF